MSGTKKGKLETLANILIIIVAVLLIGAFVQRYILSVPSKPVEPVRGQSIELKQVDFSAHHKTIILALSTSCSYCTESVPFYKRLLEATNGKNIKIIAAFPQTVDESKAYLESHGLGKIDVLHTSISTLKTSGTPTLLVANPEGLVTDFWIGKLKSEAEDEAIKQITSQ